MERVCAAIDLKSFYASVECVERGLNPLDALLVVADESRTDKTICLAVSPALKAYGVPGRGRLFEVRQKTAQANAKRKQNAPRGALSGSSAFESELSANPALALDFIAAKPRMALYMEYSARIYKIYTQYVAPEDIHVYSVDEVFMDVTRALRASVMTPRELTMTIIREVLAATGITATAGIGSNLFLSKVAMDIVAKRIPADQDGVRIAELDEDAYRRQLWAHRPLTDFWRVGRGIAKKLESVGLETMGDVARCSLGKPNEYHNEDLLYKLFGVNAELLIDHAWGWEPCRMADIKAYKPDESSLSSGQVLPAPYPFDKARLVVREMTDALTLDLVQKRLLAGQITLYIGYDVENLTDAERGAAYTGAVETDFYGRQTPKPAHGSMSLDRPTSSTKRVTDAMMALFDRIVNPRLLVRRMAVCAGRVVSEDAAPEERCEQLDLFTDYEARERARAAEQAEREREKRRQLAVLEIKQRFGKNAILRGMNLEEGATAKERNGQIGGHKA